MDGGRFGAKSKQPTFVKAFAEVVVKIEMIIACNHFFKFFEDVKVIVFRKSDINFRIFLLPANQRKNYNDLERNQVASSKIALYL